MPILFLLVGALLLAAGVNGKSSELVTLVKGDFVPSNNNGGGFGAWAAAIFIIGAVGYIKPLKPVANSFLVLVVIVLLLWAGNPQNSSGGFFTAFNKAIRGN